MGFMVVYGQCWSCGVMFTFNPQWVPSFPVNGDKEPICRDCINLVNRRREEAGLEPFWVSPEAYEPQET